MRKKKPTRDEIQVALATLNTFLESKACSDEPEITFGEAMEQYKEHMLEDTDQQNLK